MLFPTVQHVNLSVCSQTVPVMLNLKAGTVNIKFIVIGLTRLFSSSSRSSHLLPIIDKYVKNLQIIDHYCTTRRNEKP